MRIRNFEWDEHNVLHLELGHGIKPEEAEEVFAVQPLLRRTRKGHYAAMGPTLDGRFLTIVFEMKRQGLVRVITGWDMPRNEKAYWHRHKAR